MGGLTFSGGLKALILFGRFFGRFETSHFIRPVRKYRVSQFCHNNVTCRNSAAALVGIYLVVLGRALRAMRYIQIDQAVTYCCARSLRRGLDRRLQSSLAPRLERVFVCRLGQASLRGSWPAALSYIYIVVMVRALRTRPDKCGTNVLCGNLLFDQAGTYWRVFWEVQFFMGGFNLPIFLGGFLGCSVFYGRFERGFETKKNGRFGPKPPKKPKKKGYS